MTTPVEMLPWDSSQFGFPVARWLGDPDAGIVAETLPILRGLGIRLVYLFSGTSGTAPSLKMQDIGARWVDRKTRFGRAILPPILALGTAKSFPFGDPSPSMVELAMTSGSYSRFKLDPQMPHACFEALYRTWIRRSTAREIADEVLVAGEEGKIQGMVTIRIAGSAAHIGLIAVEAAARGKGLGRTLIRAAECWAFDRGAERMEVVTQGGNQAACSLYERCGYRVISEEDVYHLWIAQEAP